MKPNLKWSGLLVAALAAVAVIAGSGAAKAAPPETPVRQEMDGGTGRLNMDGGMPTLQGSLRGSAP